MASLKVTFLTIALFLSTQVQGYLKASTRNNTWTAHPTQAAGHAIFCCNNKCIDKTDLSQNTGACQGYDSLCTDIKPTPKCSKAQVLAQTAKTAINAGRGACNGAGGCVWQKYHYSYGCFDCPKGMLASRKGLCNETSPYSDVCVGCTDPTEDLVEDQSALGYKCVMSERCQMNAAGLKMLKEFEHYCPNYYNIAGHKTIGYGHDCCVKKDCALVKPPLDEPTAAMILTSDLKPAVSCIKSIPGVQKMNTNQFSAFVDFAFNAGCNAPPYTDKKGVYHSGRGFKQLFKTQIASQDWTAACSAMPSKATTANGKPLEGLRKRRAAEAKLCNTPTQTLSGCSAPSTKRDVEAFVGEERVSLEMLDAKRLLARADPFCPAWKGGAKDCL